jgi:hypothetical protein
MGIDKSEVKVLTANAIGADLEDMKEIAEKNELRHEGGKSALATAAKAVAQLTPAYMKMLEDSEIDLEALRTPLGLETFIKRLIGRAIGSIDNLHEQAKIAHATSAGMASAYQKAMGVPKRMADEELRKAQALLAAIKEAEASGGDIDLTEGARPRGRAVGRHPGNPLAERRAAGKKTVKKAATKKKATKRRAKKKAVAKKE